MDHRQPRPLRAAAPGGHTQRHGHDDGRGEPSPGAAHRRRALPPRLLLLGLLASLAVGLGGCSCAGAGTSGAVGLVTLDDGSLAVVVTDERIAGGRPERWDAVRLDADGATGLPRPPPVGVRPSWPTEDLVWGRTEVLPVTEWPVPAGRRVLVERQELGCGGGDRRPVAVAPLPGADGRRVVAVGADGIAVERVDGGWDRLPVAGAVPVPTTLREGTGVLRNLAVDVWPSAALVAALALGGVVRTRRRAGLSSNLLQVAALLLCLPALGLGALASADPGRFAQSLAPVAVVLMLVAALGTVTLPATGRVLRRLVGAVTAGTAAGTAVLVTWLAGAPLPHGLVQALAVAVAGIVTVVAVGRLDGPGGEPRSAAAGPGTRRTRR